MTTAEFNIPAAERQAGVLGAAAMWVAVLILALTVGYNASATYRVPVQTLSDQSADTTPAPQIEDTTPAPQIEDWHGNVRRSGPDYRY